MMEKAWLLLPDFDKLVTKAWKRRSRVMGARAIFEKNKNVNEAVINWRKPKRSFKMKKDNALNEVNSLDQKLPDAIRDQGDENKVCRVQQCLAEAKKKYKKCCA